MTQRNQRMATRIEDESRGVVTVTYRFMVPHGSNGLRALASVRGISALDLLEKLQLWDSDRLLHFLRKLTSERVAADIIEQCWPGDGIGSGILSGLYNNWQQTEEPLSEETEGFGLEGNCGMRVFTRAELLECLLGSILSWREDGWVDGKDPWSDAEKERLRRMCKVACRAALEGQISRTTSLLDRLRDVANAMQAAHFIDGKVRDETGFLAELAAEGRRA